jgi:hypothetical protein
MYQHMKNQLLNKRIPTLFGIGVIVLGILLTIVAVKDQTSLNSKASSSQEPQYVKIANISDTSFTITYQTDSPATGSISYGHDKKLGESELEDVDKEKGSFSPKKIHSVSVKKLMPATKYYLTITSGSNTFLNNGIPFEVTTGYEISSKSARENTVKGSSTITNDGKFNFPLKKLRTDDLSSYFNANEDTVFKIFATDGSLKSTALASLHQAGSIPTITLSNDYDFTQKTSPVGSGSAKQLFGFPSVIFSEKNIKPEILSPKNNQSFTDRKPQFRGTSLPNEEVEIIIHSDEQIITRVTADGNGNWTYKPPNDLSPGAHTITIKSRNGAGILTTVMQSFTVFAAEITPTPTQSVLPTSIPIQTQTPTPSPSPSPIIISPSFSPSPTFMPIESKGGLPPTGTSHMPIVIGGIAAAFAGIVLFLLTRSVL